MNNKKVEKKNPLVYNFAIIRKKSDMQPDFLKYFSLVWPPIDSLVRSSLGMTLEATIMKPCHTDRRRRERIYGFIITLHRDEKRVCAPARQG